MLTDPVPDWVPTPPSARFGVRSERELAHANSSPRPSGAEQHITHGTRDIIHGYYIEDFEHFGYER